MSNKDAEIKKALKEDYPLIPMKDITDEARIIAVAWMECGDKNWIGQKHKLASDIMNYARRRSAEKDKEISTLEATIQEQDKQIIEKGKEIERLTKLVHEAFSKFRYRSFPHNEPTWEQFAKENNIEP